MGETNQRIDSFDGLRAIAILIVFVNHAATQFAPGGAVGVQVFFALSGYLITSILIREHGRDGHIRLGRFYYRRLLRLYPALIVVTIIATVVSVFAGLDNIWQHAAAAATYTSNFGPLIWGGPITGPLNLTWSLSVEEQFYLLWPLGLIGLLGLSVWKRGTTLTVAVLAATVATGISFVTLGGPTTYVMPFTQAPALLAGCAVALFKEPLAKSGIFGALPVWVSSAVILAATQVLPYGSVQLNLGGYLIVAVASAVIIGHLAGGTSAMSRVLSVRPLVWLGQRSYAFYLIHSTALVVGDLLPIPGPVQAAIGLVISLAFAAVSWRVIEKPFLRLKDKLDDRSARTIWAAESPKT